MWSEIEMSSPSTSNVSSWCCEFLHIHAYLYTHNNAWVHIFLKTQKQRERGGNKQGQDWQKNQMQNNSLSHSFSHSLHMSAHTHIDTHSTSMPKVLCTFQTLFSPLLNLAACCSHLCLPSWWARTRAWEQAALCWSWMTPFQRPLRRASSLTVGECTHAWTHTHTHCTTECVHLCVYRWLSFKWVSVWCLLIMNSMMWRHVHAHTYTNTYMCSYPWNMYILEAVSKHVCLSSGWVTGVWWTWIAWMWNIYKALHEDTCMQIATHACIVDIQVHCTCKLILGVMCHVWSIVPPACC